MWFRVFGTNDRTPEPAALLEQLQGLGVEVSAQFRGDDQGWFSAALICNGVGVVLDRFLVNEESLRSELNTWAAWLETVADNPNHGPLMQHVIGTKQLFTLEYPTNHAPMWPSFLCQFLAQATAGVYQVDRLGFFGADGTLLLPEDENQ
jgi:hypothetical protein